MDEGDVEDVGMVSRAEDVRAQAKERNVLGQSESVVFRERDLPRSSVQQFCDLLDGNDHSSAVNVVDVSQGPCTNYGESGEGRVHELTLGRRSSGFGGNEGEMMDEMLNEWQHGHLLGGGSGAEMSGERPNLERNCSTTSSLPENLRHADVLAGQSSGHNANVNAGCSTHNGSDNVSRDALSSGGMRMKIINRSSEYPEFFIKDTLKGKGVLCRHPISLGAEGRGHNIVKAAAPLTSSNPVNIRETSDAPSSHGTAASEFGVRQDSVDAGVTLREWIKSGQSKMHKVDSLCIFKEILDLVYAFHSDGKVLVDLRPSCFRLLPSRKIRYCGRVSLHKEMTATASAVHKDVLKSHALKRPLEQGASPYFHLGGKHPKSTDNVKNFQMKPQFQLGYGLTSVTSEIDANIAGPGDTIAQGNSSRRYLPPFAQQHGVSVVDQLEDKWYRSPEELLGRNLTSSSNIYCLGVFLFELLGSFNSGKVHAAAMSDLSYRILPPNFLSENPKEAGFCLWLLHPEPSLRPTASDVLRSEVIGGFQALCGDDNSSCIEQDEEDSELLLHFLLSMKEQKQNDASKLVYDLGCIEADIKELEKRHLFEKPTSEGRSLSSEVTKDSRFLKNVAQLQSAYFSARAQIHESFNNYVVREDREILINRENWFANRGAEEESAPVGYQGAFFDGLCKYARYSKMEVCGTLRNREITNSMNVICSLSFDREGEYFAAAGVSKKIKIFELQALCDNSVDIHYPANEMSNKSKLSCVCWNNYIRNYLASTDYDGIVKLWDASTGQGFSQYVEHEKRSWSVDFSLLDPTNFASGSDDCSVKLWNINERNSLHTIRNIANVCCVQFSPHSSHLLAFGSADYKIYCFDLRNANVPWCILGGHEKAVSYVKFVDSGTLVSASTDNTLKLWDLNRSSPAVLSSNACSLTLKGHTNERNFVGLSVADGYIACGSETNEVYTYYKSLPMPITSHKFGSINPISGKETDDDNGQFVSSVCWKGKSNMVVAANSSGCIKVLQMV